MNKLAWIDLETTNGIPNGDPKRDPILEVALVITGMEPGFAEETAISLVIDPDRSKVWEGWQERMPPEVVKMHTKSGLLKEVPFGVSLFEARQTLLETLGRFGEMGDFVLAGSGVGLFDERWLAAQMPQVREWMAPLPVFDIGNLRRFFRYSDRLDLSAHRYDKIRHRAIDDVNDHLEEVRLYARYLKHLPEGG